jgi:hypothetical protein
LCIHSQLFSALQCRSPVIDWWTIELGVVDAGGRDLIWPQSDGAASANETFFKYLVITTLVLIALALLLLLVLPAKEEEEVQMPKLPTSSPGKPTHSNKTAAMPSVLRSGPVRFFDFQMGQPQPQPV